MRGSVSAVLNFLRAVQALTPEISEATQTSQATRLLAVICSSRLEHADATAVMELVQSTPLLSHAQKSALL